MNLNFDFNSPTRILFGSGKIDQLGDIKFPGKKALLLMSNGKSAKISGGYDKTIAGLKKANIKYVEFSKIMENPVKEIVMEAASFAKENGCDFILSLGGGAVLDSAVAISAMATNDGDLWDYIVGGTGKGLPLKHKGLPMVNITLTAGTGSEVNFWGVISNTQTKEKIGFSAPGLEPVLAIVDPTLMTTVPPKYTAFQGFDALFHHTEVMMSNKINIMGEMIALTSIENIVKYLPKAVANGNDLEARERVAYGSTMAGLTMQLCSTICQHGMEHAMSAHYPNLPHGAGLIMISIEIAKFFIAKKACDEQLIKMSRVMGIPNADKPEDFVTALINVQKACGVYDLKMSDYGIEKSSCREMAKTAIFSMTGTFKASPCPMTEDECTEVFEKSYK